MKEPEKPAEAEAAEGEAGTEPLPQMETNQLLKVIKKRVMIKNLLKKRNKLLKLNTTTH